ncbi:MAG: tRNA-dependent cyclodipeptide synthase [Thiotrichaceae bacterium]
MILMGMANYFKEVVVIVPDLPALHTYRALGYNEHDAMEKVKNHRQGVERCYRRVSEQVLLNFGRQNIKILMWGDDFTQEKYYQQACDRAFEIYRNNPEFSKTILHNTEHYILARLEGQNVQQLGGMKNIAKKAAHYLIEEMAFHEQLHIVLGREPIVSYYRELELGINYINGDYDNLQNEHVGYVTYNIIDGE